MSRTQAPSLISFNVLSIKILIFLSPPLQQLNTKTFLCKEEVVEAVGDADCVPASINGIQWKTKEPNTSFYTIYNTHPVGRDYTNPDLQKLWFFNISPVQHFNFKTDDPQKTIQLFKPHYSINYLERFNLFLFLLLSFYIEWLRLVYIIYQENASVQREHDRWLEDEKLNGFSVFVSVRRVEKKTRIERIEKAKMWGRSVIYCGQCTIRFPNLSNGLWISWRVIFMWSLFIFRERSVGIIMC